MDIPVTMPSEVLVRNVPIDFKGEKLTVDRIECSKMSMAVYFPGNIDSATGILNSFAAWDKDGRYLPGSEPTGQEISSFMVLRSISHFPPQIDTGILSKKS